MRARARGGLGVCAFEGKKQSTCQTVEVISNIVRPRAHTTPPPCRANQALLGTGTLAAGRPRVGALESIEKVAFGTLGTVLGTRLNFVLIFILSPTPTLGVWGGAPSRGYSRGGGAPRVFYSDHEFY